MHPIFNSKLVAFIRFTTGGMEHNDQEKVGKERFYLAFASASPVHYLENREATQKATEEEAMRESSLHTFLLWTN